MRSLDLKKIDYLPFILFILFKIIFFNRTSYKLLSLHTEYNGFKLLSNIT